MSTWKLGVLLGGAVTVIVVYAFLGMPGMDHGTSTGSDAAHPPSDELAELTPQQFAEALHVPDAVVINVHVPYAGEIEGTNAFIRYDEISRGDELPTDIDQPLLLYCRSGRMSRIAGNTLVDAGYTNVAHLSGGMEAWAASGRPLLNEPSRSRRRGAGSAITSRTLRKQEHRSVGRRLERTRRPPDLTVTGGQMT